MQPNRLRLAAPVVLAVSLGLSACGGGSDAKDKATAAASSKSTSPSSASTPSSSSSSSSGDANASQTPTAAELWKKAGTRLTAYKTVKIHSVGTQHGEKIDSTYSGDVSGEKSTSEAKLGDGTASVIIVDSTQYVKANADYWKTVLKSRGLGTSQVDKMAGQAADKWVKIPVSSSALGGLKTLFTDLTKASDMDGKHFVAPTAKVTKEKFDGKDAWKISDAASKATVWVAADGTNDVLGYGHLTRPGAEGDAVSTIIEHDKTYDIKAPSGAVDVDSFK